MTTPLRKVCQVLQYQTRSSPRYGYTLKLTLECGHTVWRKSSAYNGGRAHCKQCPDLSGPSHGSPALP